LSELQFGGQGGDLPLWTLFNPAPAHASSMPSLPQAQLFHSEQRLSEPPLIGARLFGDILSECFGGYRRQFVVCSFGFSGSDNILV
jgi:hypothetical protein